MSQEEKNNTVKRILAIEISVARNKDAASKTISVTVIMTIRSRRGEKSSQGQSDNNQNRDSKIEQRQNDSRSKKRNQRNQRNDQAKKDNNNTDNTSSTENKQNEESGIKRRPDDRKRGPRRRRRRQDVPQEMLENNVDAANTDAPGVTNEEAPKETAYIEKKAAPKASQTPRYTKSTRIS